MRMWSLGMAIGLRLKLGAVILLAPFVTLFPGYIPRNKVTKGAKSITAPSFNRRPIAIPRLHILISSS